MGKWDDKGIFGRFLEPEDDVSEVFAAWSRGPVVDERERVEQFIDDLRHTTSPVEAATRALYVAEFHGAAVLPRLREIERLDETGAAAVVEAEFNRIFREKIDPCNVVDRILDRLFRFPAPAVGAVVAALVVGLERKDPNPETMRFCRAFRAAIYNRTDAAQEWERVWPRRSDTSDDTGNLGGSLVSAGQSEGQEQ